MMVAKTLHIARKYSKTTKREEKNADRLGF